MLPFRSAGPLSIRTPLENRFFRAQPPTTLRTVCFRKSEQVLKPGLSVIGRREDRLAGGYDLYGGMANNSGLFSAPDPITSTALQVCWVTGSGPFLNNQAISRYGGVQLATY